MAQSAKRELKKTVIDALEPFARAIQGDFRKVNSRFDKVDGSLDNIDSRLSSVERDVKWMKENMSELFIKLDRFIALYEKQEQEMIILSEQMRRLEDRVARLEARRS